MASKGAREMPVTLECSLPIRDAAPVKAPRSAGTRACGAHRAACAGFTLFELLVVLALLGLVAGMTLPAGVRALEAARERAVEREVRLVLAGLPLEAFRSGLPLEVPASALRQRLTAWPQGWLLELDQPLAYSAEGVARGGQVRLQTPQGRLQTWVVEPYTGALTPARTP